MKRESFGAHKIKNIIDANIHKGDEVPTGEELADMFGMGNLYNASKLKKMHNRFSEDEIDDEMMMDNFYNRVEIEDDKRDEDYDGRF